MNAIGAIREYLATAFRWQEGRQGTGYDKMLLITAPWPVPFDGYDLHPIWWTLFGAWFPVMEYVFL